MWILDITSDVGISVFVALSRCYEGANDLTIMGVGAHLDPQIAAIRALTEMNQSLANFPRGSSCEPAKLERWLTPNSLLAAKLSDYPFLVPDPDQQPKQPSDLAKFDATDLVDAIQACLARVHSLGLEVLVHDLTRPDVGLPVVKVFIPQMRIHWRRLAPGRLYEVPVKQGWLDKPLAEADLNPLEFG